MIPTAILHEHEGKLVTVYTNNRTFEGILEVKNSGLLVALKQEDIWDAERFGPFYIDSASLTAIREIKPRTKKDYDEGEPDCCEKESPKARFKGVKYQTDEAKSDESKTKLSDEVVIIGIDYSADYTKSKDNE